jgi:hypothetical protein
MALHNDVGRYSQLYGGALGSSREALDSLVAFTPIADPPTDLEI